MVPQSRKAGSSAYSTGGGGVHLEQEYAGSALASLLLEQPVEGLGDDFTPTQVAMQQEAQSPVDDVIIHGVSPGGERTLRVACRRRATLGKSKKSTVKLFAKFLQVVLQDSRAIDAGQVRLGLAVARGSGSTGELATLTEIARRQPSRASFQAAINASGAYSSKVRSRLKNIDEIVEAALGHLGVDNETKQSADELSWHLLRGLFVIDLRLEGDVAPGRTEVVTRLRALTGDLSRAEDLRLRLVEIASQAAVRNGKLTQVMVRRELRSFGLLGASPSFGSAWPQISLLEAELQDRTQRSLPVSGVTTFILDRSDRQGELVKFISTAPPGSTVLVHGEPDVGKSALTLAAVDTIRASGGAAIAMSLRDLPRAAVDLRVALGLNPAELLAAAPSAPVSALVLDGAEVVQEGEYGTLGALLNAAIAVGITTVLVARDDASGAVRDLVKTRGGDKLLVFGVDPLSDTEIAVLVQAIPELARLTLDQRAAWLLRRIGLAELILKAAQGGGDLPATLSSEAEIFATVWSSLIRRNEVTVNGVSPDDRERAIIDVARQLLNGTPSQTTGAALPSLRSDGILLSKGRSAVWESGDRFVSDVFRDYATARLLVCNGPQLVVASKAPRWAIRATRLFAQIQLTNAVAHGGNIAERWTQLRAEFAELSAAHGARWAELPWEALLTAGWVDQALSELTPSLLDSTDMRAEAIRTLNLRFSQAGACDPIIGAPMVSWLVDKAGILDRPRSHRDDPVLKLVLSWLRGVARLEVAGQDVTLYRALRSRVRDVLLRREIERSETEQLESLGLLGNDSNEASVGALDTIKQIAPGFLAPVVESPDVAMLLSKQNPALLADLAGAYYLEQPSKNLWIDLLEGEGIRGHQGGGGLGEPLAAWYRGPFLPLLRQDFSRGHALINRMLDRGARRRTNMMSNIDDRFDGSLPANPTDEGVRLELLGAGSRLLVGDFHAWSWYRGSSVGPYPCMSALFSLEMVMDEQVELGVSPRSIAAYLLRDATTLATAGLVYGFLVRHIEVVSDELDGFLAVPDVWQLEFGRVRSEGLLHVQGADAPELAGRDRRRWTPYQVATQLVLAAAQYGDDEAVKRLRAVGRRLVQTAGGEAAPPLVRQWAAHLDLDSYSLSAQDGRRVLELKVPEDVIQALAPAQARAANIAEMYRLQNRYRPRLMTPYRAALATPPERSELADDFRAVRRLETELFDDETLNVLRALAGVAASVFQNAANGLSVPDQSVEWAFSLLVGCATSPYRERFGDQAFRDGPDRQAALALPLAFVHTDDTDDEQLPAEPPRDAIQALGALSVAMAESTSSPAIEVRHNAAEGLRAVSGQPCGRMADGRCWHELLWHAIEVGARSVTLGDPSENGRRHIESIIGDVVVALATRPVQDLMLTHIAPAAICALDAAKGETCIRARAERLRNGLLDAYARAACYWANKHYNWRDEQHASFASAVLRWAAAENRPVVTELAEQLSASPDALADYLHALIIVATHEADVVPSLVEAWPQLMEVGLAHVRIAPRTRARSDEKLLRNLIPSPSAFGYSDDLDAVFAKARANWFPLAALSGHMDEWLEWSRGQMTCVDALVGFLEAQPVHEQVSHGLEWVCRLVVGEDGTALTSGFLLVSWLARLRDSPNFRLAPNYHALVDALVLRNYTGARKLQRRDE